MLPEEIIDKYWNNNLDYNFEWTAFTDYLWHATGYSNKVDEEGWFYSVYLRDSSKHWGTRMKVQKIVRFRRKWKARDRAYKWHCDLIPYKQFESLHNHALKGVNVRGVDFNYEYRCLVNVGYEDRFDLGVTYIGRYTKRGKSLHLMDKYGNYVSVDASMFQRSHS